MYIHKS